MCSAKGTQRQAPNMSWFQPPFPPSALFLIPGYAVLELAGIIRFLGLLLDVSLARAHTHTHTRVHTLSANTHVTLCNVFVSCLLFFLLTVYLGNRCLSVAKEILYSFSGLHGVTQEFIMT